MKFTTAYWLCLAASLGLFQCSNLWAQATDTRPTAGIIQHPVSDYAIVGARIFTEPGKVIEKGSIIVKDGKIAEVGESLSIPPTVKVVDLTGKTIYAGFVDAGVEFELATPETSRGTPHWNSEITPEKSVANTNGPNAATLTKLKRAGIGAALVAPNSGIIKGKSAVVLTGDESLINSLVKPDVGLHVRLTVSRGGLGGGGRSSYPSSPMGAVALARQTFLDAQWYEKSWRAYRAAAGLPKPENNAALEAIVDHTDPGKPVIFDALNEQYVLRADAFAREFGLNAVIRTSGQEYQLLDLVAKTKRPMIVSLNFPKPPNVATAEAALDAELEELMHWELAPENPGRLAKAGIKIALTTQGLSDPSEFVNQIRKAIKRGLDPVVALQAITTTPASLLGVESQVGKISSGAWANLVVTSGDLWDDKTKIEEVWVAGVRPATAFKQDVSIDGKWELTAIGSPAASKLPQTLTLVVSDSTKKVAATLQLPKVDSAKGDAAKSEEKTEDSKSSESKSNESKNDGKPEGTKADVPKPEDAKTDSSKSEQSKDNKPADDNPVDDKKVEDKPTDNKSAADKSDAKDTSEKTASESKSDDKKKAEAGKAPLKNPRWGENTLKGSFTSKQLVEGSSGVGYLSLALIKNQEGQSVLGGTIQWSDGTVQSVRGAKFVESKDDAKKDDAKPADAKKEDSSERPGPRGGRAGRGDPSGTKDAREQPAEVAQKDAPVISTLRYPFGAFGRTGIPEQPEVVVIQNTILWTCGPQGLLKDADIVIRRGIIDAIGADLPVPEGAIVIDGSKFQVSPGLIDCHSHMATDSGVNEGSQAVTAEVRIGDFINAEDVTIYRQLAGGLTTANVLHGSANPIGGQNQVIKLRWGGWFNDLKFKDAPAGIKFALGENVKQSNNTETTRPIRYPSSRMGVEQIFRDRLNAAVEYDRQWKQWNSDPQGLPPRRDLELDAIAEIVRGERWIHCHSYRQDEILALLRVLEEYKIRIGSLQHILEGYKVADAIAKHGATASSFSDWWAYKFEVIDAIPYNGAIMHNQGIIVSFNSDDAELGRHMNHEAAKAIKYGGVEPMEALKFVTLNPAKQLRIEQYVGSLEVGKQADLALWSGSPLSATSRCEQTWIDGRKYFDRSVDLEVRKKEAELHRQLVQKILDSGETAGERGPLADDPARLWPNYDEYCHHHHDDEHDHGHDHSEHEHSEEEAEHESR